MQNAKACLARNGRAQRDEEADGVRMRGKRRLRSARAVRRRDSARTQLGQRLRMAPLQHSLLLPQRVLRAPIRVDYRVRA